MFSANGVSTIFINPKETFINGPRSHPSYTILDIWVFDSFLLADKVFAKSLRSLETCVSVINDLCGKSFLSLETPNTFEERFKVTLVPFSFLILIY